MFDGFVFLNLLLRAIDVFIVVQPLRRPDGTTLYKYALSLSLSLSFVLCNSHSPSSLSQSCHLLEEGSAALPPFSPVAGGI